MIVVVHLSSIIPGDGHCRTRSDNPAKSGLDPRDKHEGDKKECIAPALLEAKRGDPGSSPGQRYSRLFFAAHRFEHLIIRDDCFRVGMIVAERGAEDFDGALKVVISLVWLAMF